MSNDRDLKGVLLLNYNLKKINSKYEYNVITIENVSEQVKNILKNNNINVIEINFKNILSKFTDDLSFVDEIINRHYYGKFLIFELLQFKKVVYLDTDLLLLKNIDHLFEKETSDSLIHMVNDILKKKTESMCHIVNNTYNSGVIICEPNKNISSILFKLITDLGLSGFKKIGTDQCILNKAIHNNLIKCQTLDAKYNISPCLVYDFVNKKIIDTPYIIHFILSPKPWDILDGTYNNNLYISKEVKLLFNNWINLYTDMIKDKYLSNVNLNSQYCNEYRTSLQNEDGSYTILKEKKLKIAVLMWYDDAIKEYADINYELNKMYCHKYDLDLILSDEKTYTDDRHLVWERLPYILKHIKNYDYVVYIDSDAFFYKDANDIRDIIKLNINSSFIFSEDHPHSNIVSEHIKVINCGVFIVKNTEYAFNFLNTWAYNKYLYDNNPAPIFKEQGVCICMYNNNILDIKNNSTLHDYGVIQQFHENEFPKNAYILHLAGQSNEKRIEISKKYYDNENIIIKDEHGHIINTKLCENGKQKIANHFINENDIVLELGGRYGSVSCVINKKLNDKKNHIVVEPDETVWNALEFNKIVNNCNFNIIKGFISNKKHNLINLGYGSTSIENNNSTIPSYTLKEIKETYNIDHFNVLVADCEGFLETFIDENPDLINDLRLIHFEADYPNKCNYDKIRNILKENNFTESISGFQNVWIK